MQFRASGLKKSCTAGTWAIQSMMRRRKMRGDRTKGKAMRGGLIPIKNSLYERLIPVDLMSELRDSPKDKDSRSLKDRVILACPNLHTQQRAAIKQGHSNLVRASSFLYVLAALVWNKCNGLFVKR